MKQQTKTKPWRQSLQGHVKGQQHPTKARSACKGLLWSPIAAQVMHS